MKIYDAAVSIAVASFCILLTNTASAGSARVVDGGTLEIGEVTDRLHGSDAPEASQSCNISFGKNGLGVMSANLFFILIASWSA